LDTGGNVGFETTPDGWPMGGSTFDRPPRGLNGPIWRLPRGTVLPDGWMILEDGSNVGGPHMQGHHTIFLTRPVPPQQVIDMWFGLGWMPEP
jgi:hypothetical protein